MAPDRHGQGHGLGNELGWNILERVDGGKNEMSVDRKGRVRKIHTIYGFLSATFVTCVVNCRYCLWLVFQWALAAH